MLKLGIDDAGRGPVIGPMVLAGCLINEKTEREFKKLGVTDSKQLTPKRREFLADIIREKAETFEVIIIHPEEIDGKNKDGIKLNEVEAFACAQIIDKINSSSNAGGTKIKVVLDCPSTNLTKWQDFLKLQIDNLSNLEISCEHKADKNHIAVSAASILAKSAREKEMDALRKKYGSGIGSGYTSDPLTTKFLEMNLKKYNDHGIFRKSWATWKTAFRKKEQKRLGEF